MEPFRLLYLKTPLGEGALTPVRLRVTEEVGLPYTIECEAHGHDPGHLPKDLLGRSITCSVVQRVEDETITRHFNGVVTEFERLGPAPGARMAYRFVAMPEMWRLSLSSDTRIFQEMSVKAIVEKVFSDRGLPLPVAGQGWEDVGKLTHCTQFNETDLAFVSRLLEEHSYTFFFVQDDGKHEMRIGSTLNSFPAFVRKDVTALHNSPHVFDLTAWRRATRARVGRAIASDMDHERSDPSVTLTDDTPALTFPDEPDMAGNGTMRFWPAGISVTRAAQASLRMDAIEGASESYHAETQDPRYAAGVKPTVNVLKEDGSKDSAAYGVLAVQHEAQDMSEIVAGGGSTQRYRASLTLARATRNWGPARRNPRPVMPGFCTATVTGPQGEQIHVDKLGRIKVLFRWDHLGKNDDTSSCWIRVMQPAAGAWGGTWFLPRVGDEVVVAFLEGDADRPIVVGSVYGKTAPPPFDPGANRSQSGYRTRSYKSDSKEDANILRFEDKKGAEEILLHAQLNLTVTVEKDEVRTIGHDQTTTVKNQRFVKIEEGNDTLEVWKGDRVTGVKEGNDLHQVDTGNRTVRVKTGNDKLDVAQGNVSVEVGQGNEAHAVKMGNFTLKCDLGKITLEAMQEIELKVGQNSIKIDQSGITMKSMLMTIEVQTALQTKALVVKQEASGPMVIKGAITMIN